MPDGGSRSDDRGRHLALIDNYGDDATIHADELLEGGDLDGAAIWRRVLDAVKELDRTEPGRR